MSCGMDPFTLHRNDDRRSLYIRVADIESDEWVDLSPTTTVVFVKFRRKGTTTTLETITCVKLWGGACGHCRMDWPADALDDLTVADYELEGYVSYDGHIETVNMYYWEGDENNYSSTSIPVKIKADFAA